MAQHPGFGAHTDPTFTAKPRSAWEVVSRVFVYLKPYPWMAIGTIVCAIVSVAAGFAYPKLIQFVIDTVIEQNRSDLLTFAMLALLGAFLVRDLFNSIRIRINNYLEQNVIFDMRCQVYGKLQRLPVHYFDQRSSGDLMTRVIEDVNSVERILIDGTEQGSVAIISVVGILVILVAMNPLLAAVVLAPFPLLVGGVLWYTLTAHRRYRAQRQAASAMNALLMDNLQGVRQIKSFSRETHEDQRFSDRAEGLRQGTLTVMRAWATYNPVMNFLSALGLVLVVWVGGYQVANNAMNLGELVAFMFYLMMFYEPVNRLHGLNQMLQAARAAGERVFDILDTSEETASHGHHTGTLQAPLRGEVIYENVGFRYAEDRQVLKDISLHAAPGDMIALVGPTGAGKSTLVNLLPAFYPLTSGRILIDGTDIQTVSLTSLREHIAIVSQEPFLFNGSIRENILYGQPQASEDQIITAAQAANCHDFIVRLPEGYESRVGERGVKLSVGEKQRVSIARAILKNAPLLILDEATASVDTATERLIQEALEHLMAKRTSFVIAHRLSTIRNATQILVLQRGRIVERGTHEELLRLEGVYAKLAQIQNTTFIEEGFERLVSAQDPRQD